MFAREATRSQRVRRLGCLAELRGVLSHGRHDEAQATSWVWEFRPGLDTLPARSLGLVS